MGLFQKKWDSRDFCFVFCSFLQNVFWTSNKHVSPVWTEHLARYLGVQVMENQTETDVPTYLPQHSRCSRGSWGSTTKPTQPFWETRNASMELAEFKKLWYKHIWGGKKKKANDRSLCSCYWLNCPVLSTVIFHITARNIFTLLIITRCAQIFYLKSLSKASA